MVTGVDICKTQILLAAGERLKLSQQDVRIMGHAIECRINAEDPEHNFRPSPGKINTWHVPGGMGIRVDTHAYAGYVMPPFYDSLVAKLIAHGKTRAEAIERMERALEEFIVEGIKTTISFHRQIMADEVFQSGNYDVKYVENLFQRLAAKRSAASGSH